MTDRSRWWTVLPLLAVMAGAEWLRSPGSTWAWITIALTPVALWTLRRPAAIGYRISVLGTAALAVTLLVAQRNISAIEQYWPREREAQVRRASQLLAGELHASLLAADRLARDAATSAGGTRDDAFRRLSGAIRESGPEMGVAVLEATGTPWAWAGRHRVRVAPDGDSINVRSSGYYTVLETRRHAAQGRTAVGSILIWAHPVVPSGERSLAEIFRRRTGVGLAVYAPGAAPKGPDVFDYVEPTTAGPRLLFSVKPIPPEQGDARELAVETGGAVAAWIMIFILLAILAGSSSTWLRYTVLLVALWLTVRAPLGAAIGLDDLFSPATFFRTLLGPLSDSAGVLALTGVVATVAGISLWRRQLPRRMPLVAFGALLLIAAPYLISELGRGITPPSDGVPSGLWITWQLTLVLAASALIILAAALFRGERAPGVPTWWILGGLVLALSAAVVGLVVWNPRYGWPDWYPFLWTPSLILVALPTRRWATIVGIAVVSGSAAALVTWGAELNGRVQVAQRDLARLGPVQDPLAVPLLERFGEQLDSAPAPSGAAELYALWRTSPLGLEDFPARLALWNRDGVRRSELALDSLDLPASLMSTLVRNLDTTVSRRITQVYRVPGIHYILLDRVAPGVVLTAAIGPRSRLIMPDRLARLLRTPAGGSPLYELNLSPPTPGAPTESVQTGWRREGWAVLMERRIEFADGLRHVHATIDLRGPVPVLVRGALIVILDMMVLGLLWNLSEGDPMRAVRLRAGGRLSRSFRARLAVTLALFFILPAVGFATWSFVRLGNEARRGRDILITQVLRDAILTAGGLLQGSSELLGQGLQELSNRLDADLALYSGGQIVAVSAPILEQLGLVEPLLDPDAFEALALHDELEITRGSSIYSAPVRVGYRVVQSGPPGGIGVLATPQLADEWSQRENQVDLALVLLLATLMGGAAALLGAQAAARALSRPVADLRRSAIAIGQGQPLPPLTGPPPIEFDAVFGAFERMAADIRSSQAALEDARRRTATVLANVATGVVALEADGRVLLANPRAKEMLDHPLPEGEPLTTLLGAPWLALTSVVRKFIAEPARSEEQAEVEVGGRRLRLQLARLGSDPSGVVVALNDLTDVTQAERVLAWGEMARQVAHEIKNPLTPMRLGIQHLGRVYRDRRGSFDDTLAETSARILAEIDRLDTIARAFSRFAAPAGGAGALERVELRGVAQEIVELYRLAGEGVDVVLLATLPTEVSARRDEVKEVLGNLLENARNAEARTIRIRVGDATMAVEDDGHGIPPENLPKIFEPRFSTTTSGSGLGLAIVRRLVEGWGARVEVESVAGRGTTVEIRWRAAELAASPSS